MNIRGQAENQTGTSYISTKWLCTQVSWLAGRIKWHCGTGRPGTQRSTGHFVSGHTRVHNSQQPTAWPVPGYIASSIMDTCMSCWFGESGRLYIPVIYVAIKYTNLDLTLVLSQITTFNHRTVPPVIKACGRLNNKYRLTHYRVWRFPC